MARILVVEDERATRKLVVGMLEQGGHQVKAVESGEEGIGCFHCGSFAVVLSDVNLPAMDGLAMIRQMRREDPSLAPVVMTSRQDQGVAVEALESGVVGFLAKPFSAERLQEEIARALAERQRRLDLHFLMGDLLTERSTLQQRMQANDRQLSRAEREREALEEQLVSAQRLSVLGELAPRIAHEFKVPLQLICGYVELALELLAAGEIKEARSSIEQVGPATMQLKDLVQQISELGKPTVPRRELVDLRAQIERALESVRPLGIVRHCQVERQFAADLPLVVADPGQICQALRNLIVNAAQAMERSPRRVLTLRLGRGERGGEVVAEVADSGPGIGPGHLERIFDPFFTTKEQGTGLGLPIVRSILHRHGAELHVESKPDQGACFTMVFPVSSPAVLKASRG